MNIPWRECVGSWVWRVKATKLGASAASASKNGLTRCYASTSKSSSPCKFAVSVSYGGDLRLSRGGTSWGLDFDVTSNCRLQSWLTKRSHLHGILRRRDVMSA